MLLIALAIKLDSKGPVLFKQRRYGFNNEFVEIYKFRSMYVEAADADREQARDQRRSARHPRRPFHPQDQPRRIAATVQCRLHRQPVAGRPAAACHPGQGRQAPLRRSGRRLFRAAPRETGDHRLGADQRLARRNRQPRKNPAARRARSLLHRELVDPVRPLHRAANAVRADPRREALIERY